MMTYNNINKEIGLKIHNARKNKKMTMKELGKEVGLHESTISRYEKGDIQSLDIETIKKFAKVLEVDASYLSGWDRDSLDYVVGEDKEIVSYFLKHDSYDLSGKMNIEQLSYKKLLNSAGYDLAYENSNFYLVGDMGAILVSETELHDLIKTSVDNAILEIDRITLKKMKENN